MCRVCRIHWVGEGDIQLFCVQNFEIFFKSSTISIMTGHQLATSDSVSSVTTECELYTNLMDGEAASWLDTVGWEDRKKDDMESFRKPLSFINKPFTMIPSSKKSII